MHGLVRERPRKRTPDPLTYARSRQPCGPAIVPGLKIEQRLSRHGQIWHLKLKPYWLNVRVERGQCDARPLQENSLPASSNCGRPSARLSAIPSPVEGSELDRVS
jgi:hypothetical protein